MFLPCNDRKITWFHIACNTVQLLEKIAFFALSSQWGVSFLLGIIFSSSHYEAAEPFCAHRGQRSREQRLRILSAAVSFSRDGQGEKDLPNLSPLMWRCTLTRRCNLPWRVCHSPREYWNLTTYAAQLSRKQSMAYLMRAFAEESSVFFLGGVLSPWCVCPCGSRVSEHAMQFIQHTLRSNACYAGVLFRARSCAVQ